MSARKFSFFCCNENIKIYGSKSSGPIVIGRNNSELILVSRRCHSSSQVEGFSFLFEIKYQ